MDGLIDTGTPEFWNERYASGETPWVIDKVPAALDAFLRRTTPGAALIPGYGNHHAVIRAFHAARFAVTGIDFSPEAVRQAKIALGSLGNRLIVADFFEHDFGSKRFDVVYDRTFLCALNPSCWKEYGSRVADLLRPGGLLVGVFFYGHESEPPPFPLTQERAAKLFGKDFWLRRNDAVTDSLPIFRDQEKWQEWERM